MQLIRIKWLDAFGYGGEWQDECEVRAGVVTVYTAGWLVEQDEHGITLAQSWADDDGVKAYFNYMNVPKGMILEMQEVEQSETEEST